MTTREITIAEKQAETDAEELALLLLLWLKKKNAKGISRVAFDASAGRFILDGKTVSIRSIRAYLTRIENRLARRLVKLTGELEAGRIGLGEWKREFDGSITSGHLLAAGLALGGIAVAARNPAVIEQIDEDLAFADNFAKEVRANKAGSFARIKARAQSYMQATHITYSIVEQTAREVIGFQTEAKRIRRASESCRGCVKYSYRWIAIELMPPIGSLPCRRFCKCFIVYR